MYKHAALGGTFDHFHLGHKGILNYALHEAEKVSIGIATSNLSSHKEFSTVIESFIFRKTAVENYLRDLGALDRVSIFTLDDIYGTTLADSSLDSIVVTEETEKNAHIINAERKKKGMSELTLLRFEYVKSPENEVINSTSIRAGLMNRTGLPYSSLFAKNILTLPKHLRTNLREALETPIFKNNELDSAKEAIQRIPADASITIGVGDIVNSTLNKAGFIPSLQIIDFRTRRMGITNMPQYSSFERFKNEAGTISKPAVLEIQNKIELFLKTNKKSTIIINGEEDLLALPAILLAPLGSVVLYGQFGKGIVLVTVTEEMKEKVANLIKQFSSDLG